MIIIKRRLILFTGQYLEIIDTKRVFVNTKKVLHLRFVLCLYLNFLVYSPSGPAGECGSANENSIFFFALPVGKKKK